MCRIGRIVEKEKPKPRIRGRRLGLSLKKVLGGGEPGEFNLSLYKFT
jgi:hypothetical protein